MHAISNAGSLESNYARAQAVAEVAELKQESLATACQQILATFDAKDVMTAFDVVSDCSPERMHRLYESMAELARLQSWSGADGQLRTFAASFDAVIQFYAGYRATKEGF